jgi:putative membrane protein
MIETILVIGLVIACTIWFMRRLWRQRARILKRQYSTELEILGARYARGEINREEYLQKRSDILGYPLIP